MAVLEALSYGVPVVTTPVGAHAEVIEPGVSGIFVAPGDVDALAGALVALIDAPEERVRLGANGRSRFEAQFHTARYRQDLTQIHLTCLAGRMRTAVNDLPTHPSGRAKPVLTYTSDR